MNIKKKEIILQKLFNHKIKKPEEAVTAVYQLLEIIIRPNYPKSQFEAILMQMEQMS